MTTYQLFFLEGGGGDLTLIYNKESRDKRRVVREVYFIYICYLRYTRAKTCSKSENNVHERCSNVILLTLKQVITGWGGGGVAIYIRTTTSRFCYLNVNLFVVSERILIKIDHIVQIKKILSFNIFGYLHLLKVCWLPSW